MSIIIPNPLNTGSAQREYFSRPIEERKDGIKGLLEATEQEKARATSRTVKASALHFAATFGNIVANIAGDAFALTFNAFNQLAGRLSAPPSFLRDLRPETLAVVLNEIWETEFNQDKGDAKILTSFKDDGTPIVRGFNGPKYGMMFSADYLARFAEFADSHGLRVPPAWAFGNDPRTRPATEQDCGPFTLVKPGDMISPAGAYYSPSSGRDTFLFTVSDVPVKLPNGSEAFRAMLLNHSETGHGAANLLSCLIDKACGNHMLLNPQDVKRYRVIHRGAATLSERVTLQLNQAREIMEAGEWESAKLQAVASNILGADIKEAITKTATLTGLSVASIRKALDRITVQDYGNPLSAYSIAGHLTEYSQTLGHVEDRRDMDDAAAILYNLA